MALWTRGLDGQLDDSGRLQGLIHYSDAGGQYTAIRYADRIADAGAVGSIGSVATRSTTPWLNRSSDSTRPNASATTDHSGPLMILNLRLCHGCIGSTTPGCTDRLATSRPSSPRTSPSVRSSPTATAAGRTHSPLKRGGFTSMPRPAWAMGHYVWRLPVIQGPPCAHSVAQSPPYRRNDRDPQSWSCESIYCCSTTARCPLRDIGFLTVVCPRPGEPGQAACPNTPATAPMCCDPQRKMIMTLQPGDKLMSLTDVSEMLGIFVHTLYRWRYKGDGPSATGWAAMCGTAERPLRLGWNSRSTSVGNCGTRISLRAVHKGIRPSRGSQGRRPSLAPRPPLRSRASCGPCRCRRAWVSDEPHSKRADRRYPTRWHDPMVASGPGHSPAKLTRSGT